MTQIKRIITEKSAKIGFILILHLQIVRQNLDKTIFNNLYICEISEICKKFFV